MLATRIVVLFLVLTCALPFGFSAGEAPAFVSLIQLIASPEKYEHKVVAVTGVLQLEFETSRLYLSRDDLQNGIMANSICLESNLAMDKEAKDLNGKYIIVFGVFSGSHCGTDNFKMGRVAHISRFSKWPAASQ